MKKRILIVGGTGFIGSNLLRICLRKGFHCTTISRSQAIIKNPIDGVKYIQADIREYEHLRNAIKGASFEYVVNLSGYIEHTPFFDGGEEVINSHFTGLQNLLRVLDRENLRRFIQIGSSDEYGNIPAPQKESFREAPISPYSLAKTASTHLLQMLHHNEQFPAVTLRLFLVYGKGQDDSRFLPQIIKGCIKGKKFPTSMGEQLRDFCHVDDISDGIVSAFTKNNIEGEVINLGSGAPISIRMMIENISKIIGSGFPQYGQIPYRSGENMALYPDIHKALKLLDWKPKIDLDEGLKSTIKYYEEKFLNSH